MWLNFGYRSLLLLLLLGQFWLSLWGQQQPFTHSRLIDRSSGLPDERINCLSYDWAGFLWIGTENGLCRFDGTKSKVFFHNEHDSSTLSDNRIYQLQPDTLNKVLWIGTRFGLNRYDPLTETFTRFYHDPRDSSTLPDSWIRPVHLDKRGRLWVGFLHDGIVKFDPQNEAFERHPLNFPEGRFSAKALTEFNSVNGIFNDPHDTEILWLTTDQGLIQYQVSEKRVLEAYTHTDPEIPLFLYQAYFHDDGRVYLGSSSQGLLTFDPSLGKFQQLRVHDQQSDTRDRIRSISRKSAGQIWITTQHGLVLWDTREEKALQFLQNDAGRKRHYGADLIDEEGRIWARSAYGLHLFDPNEQKASNYYFQSHPPGNPRRTYSTLCIAEDPHTGDIYAGAQFGKGIYRLNRSTGTWTCIPPPDAFLERDSFFHAQNLLFTQKGELLILSVKELFRLSADGQRMEAYPYPLPSTPATFFVDIIQDEQGILWIGSIKDGLIRLDPESGEIRSFIDELRTPEDSLHYRWFFNPFRASDNRIWFRARTGFTVLDPSTETFVHVPYTPLNPKVFEGIWGIGQDKADNIWVVGKKIGAIDPQNPEAGIFEEVSFPSNTTPGAAVLQRDNNGNLWTVSDYGLYRFNPVNKTFSFFGESYGLAVKDEFIQTSSLKGNALTLLSTGELAVGYLRGIGIFHPDSLEKSRELPLPYLSSFKVLGKEIERDSSLLYLHNLSLSYEQNFISFEFSAIAYSQSGKHTFAYKLEGVDPDWIHTENRNFASYAQLKGGDYTFLLQAFNLEGETAEKPYRLHIHISTPWWQTSWIKVLSVLFFLGIAYAVYRYRIYQIRREEQLRSSFERKLADVEMSALRAQMNPHFIFNCLNSIDYYIWKNDPEKASEYLNRFSRLIRLILQNSRSEFVSLKDELEALRLYVAMESLRFENQFDFFIELDPGIEPENTDIPPMLLQPYVENAIWHGLMPKGEKGTLKVEIRRKQNTLHCIIEDDGIGREAAAALASRHKTRKKSMGLRITQDRISLINRLYQTHASVEIHDLKHPSGDARGTCIELKVPL